jgi:predicted HTH transcriptional regulator
MGESMDLEFKRSTAQLRSGMETICGMLNAVGRARLLFGVSDSGELIERWGRGTNKIIDEAGRLNCPEPEFEEIAGPFVVRFRPARVKERPSSGTDGGPRTERVVALLETSGPLLASEILKDLGDAITLRALQTDLRVLRESGRIVAEGKARATRYRIARGPE